MLYDDCFILLLCGPTGGDSAPYSFTSFIINAAHDHSDLMIFFMSTCLTHTSFLLSMIYSSLPVILFSLNAPIAPSALARF